MTLPISFKSDNSEKGPSYAPRTLDMLSEIGKTKHNSELRKWGARIALASVGDNRVPKEDIEVLLDAWDKRKTDLMPAPQTEPPEDLPEFLPPTQPRPEQERLIDIPEPPPRDLDWFERQLPKGDRE